MIGTKPSAQTPKKAGAPFTFDYTVRDRKVSEDGKLVQKGQKVQLLHQQQESRKALKETKDRLAGITAQIDRLEQKKEVGINRSALERSLEELHLRYEGMLREQPGEIPKELDEQLRQAELAQKRLKGKDYESKFTAALAETQAALRAAAVILSPSITMFACGTTKARSWVHVTGPPTAGWPVSRRWIKGKFSKLF